LELRKNDFTALIDLFDFFNGHLINVMQLVIFSFCQLFVKTTQMRRQIHTIQNLKNKTIFLTRASFTSNRMKFNIGSHNFELICSFCCIVRSKEQFN
jgi:hypothetical protein